ncbi:hypothetical protein GYB22_13050 [bacterium]|nr:hypothetical protein [bacterium]
MIPPRLYITHLDEVSSTNEYVRRIVQNGYPKPCVINGGQQTASRGQRTNSWES